MPPLNTFTRSCLALAIGQAVVALAQAANIVVNDTGDTERTDLLCTLREAIESANTNDGGESYCISGDPGMDTITFTSDVLAAGTIYRTQTALLFITEDLTIEGPASGTITIDGLGKAGIFDIKTSAVTMNNLTITGGSTTGNGGGILLDDSQLILTNSTVSGNEAAVNGGGIYAPGRRDGMYIRSSRLGLTNSTVSGNSAGSEGGGLFVDYFSIVGLTNSTVSANSASWGGGIHTDFKGSVALINSTVSGNSALYGGGINAEGAMVTLINSTMSGNSAYVGGGGIHADSSSLTVINSTVSGNSADIGGGIDALSNRKFFLYNNIISGNSASGFYDDLWIFGVYGGSQNLSLRNNIFGDSSKISNESFFFSEFAPATTDIVATSDGTLPTSLSSIIKPLSENGGPTATHALPRGSPAIDAGDSDVCTNFLTNNVDQRGEQRDKKCDIGAYEFKDDTSFFVVPLPNGKSVIFGL